MKEVLLWKAINGLFRYCLFRKGRVLIVTAFYVFTKWVYPPKEAFFVLPLLLRKKPLPSLSLVSANASISVVIFAYSNLCVSQLCLNPPLLALLVIGYVGSLC
ncbi:hypothetical protein L6164_013104 [Bauhinia variegata]|uniref:Uncharacterized protein n=1 Tax=Bauhinia variegata TaxID=167791 RepID=A0ACB9PC12_BAUVA|nr:hypothetical protein L6164_013104 [Bauhinia variegata]